MVWAMSGARGFLSERVNLLFCRQAIFDRLKLRFYLVHLIQGGALIEGMRRSPHQLSLLCAGGKVATMMVPNLPSVARLHRIYSFAVAL